MNDYKLNEVYTDWICDGCSWVTSKTIKFERPLDWVRWSALAESPPKHKCENAGVLHLNSVQLLGR